MRGGPRPPGGSSLSHGGPGAPTDKPKREAILDLSKYVNEKIRVKFTGGREGTSFPFHSQTLTLHGL
jgi:U6 snRNA-associated Sm-like protein LSm7